MAVNDKEEIGDEQIFKTLGVIRTQHQWMHLEKLRIFDGKLGYSKAQGED